MPRLEARTETPRALLLGAPLAAIAFTLLVSSSFLLVVVVASVRQAWLLVLNTRGTPLHGASIGLMSSILSINTFAMFQPVFAQRFYWLPLAFVSVLWALRRQELRDRYLLGLAPEYVELQAAR